MDLTLEPLVCRKCQNELNDQFSFRENCLETENTIVNYINSLGVTVKTVDLYKVLEESSKTAPEMLVECGTYLQHTISFMN